MSDLNRYIEAAAKRQTLTVDHCACGEPILEPLPARINSVSVCDDCAAAADTPKRKTSYMDLLPEDGNFTEDDLWEAIAEANGVDYSEIADGDLAEWL